MSEFLEPSLVCIMGRNRTPVGAGCLVSARHVVTCAHVVAAAIGCDEYAGTKPTQPVPLEFAFSADGDCEAVVEAWWPTAREGAEPLDGHADLALLALTRDPPRDAKPARLVDSDNIRHQNFETLGFPTGHPLGLPTSGSCGARRRDGRILVQSQNVQIEPGFSGAPVWIEAYGAVGGILVERVIDVSSPRLAFVIPPSLLRAFAYPLAEAAPTEAFGQVFWAPDPPAGYVQRPELHEKLKATLLGTSATTAVSGLQGMGGIGKTVLASALVRDPDVQHAFPDGIYWLTLGQHADIVARQLQLARAMSRQPETFVDSQAGKARLEELLHDKRSLVVLDDVWQPGDARAFDIRNTATRLLLTTRDSRVIEAMTASEVRVPLLSPDRARDMLASFSGQAEASLPAEARDVIGEAGGLPLALAMAGRLMQGQLAGWADVLKRLRTAEIAAPRGHEAEFPQASVARAIEASIEALPTDARDLFLDLAVFPEDVPIPLSVLGRLWAARGFDSLAVAEQAEDFVARSLAGWDEERDGRARSNRLILHDLVGSHLRASVTDRTARHRRLIEAFRPASDRWTDIAANETYLWAWLSFHLLEAGRQDELRTLLLDPAWIAAKLAATDMPALLADYDRIPDDADLRLVRQALTLSAHVLARDKTQLAGQLAGRLRGMGSPDTDALVAGLDRWGAGFRLCPLTASLIVPGSGLIRTLEGHEGRVNAMAVLAEGRRALSASADRTLKLWDLESGAVLRTLEGHEGTVNAVAVLAEGRRALSASDDRTLKLWDLESGAVLRTFEGHEDSVNAVAGLAEGRQVLSASNDRTLKLWDLESGAVLRTLEGHEAAVNAVAGLAEGRRALSASDDGTLKLWDLESGAVLRTLEGHEGWVTAVAVLAEGRRALSASIEQTLKLWDLESGAVLRTLEGHEGTVNAVAVLAEGRRALSASHDGTLKLWDLESGAVLRTLEGHEGPVNAVAVLAEGRWALSASHDHTLKLWDLESGAVLATFTADAAMTSVAVAATDRFVVGSTDGRLHILRLLT